MRILRRTTRLTGVERQCVIARQNAERYVDDSQRGLGPRRFVVARERLVRPGAAPAAAASVSEFPGHAGRTARLPARCDENVQGTSRAEGQHGRAALPAGPQGAPERAVPRRARPLRADLTAQLFDERKKGGQTAALRVTRSRRVSAWRTGMSGAPWPYRTSCAQPRASRG